MFSDSHAHLDFNNFISDFEAVLERTEKAGVQKIINVGVSLKTSFNSLSLAQKYPQIWAVVGIHPGEFNNHWADLEQLEKMIQSSYNQPSSKLVGIGEIGLDYHENPNNSAEQEKLFVAQLQLAQKYNLPVIIHCRDAFEEVRQLVQDNLPRAGVFHCFSGNLAQAQQVFELGENWLIGIGGVITFSNAKILQEVAQKFSLEKILLETDCPFLAPEPHRGQRNEPSYIPLIAQKIAELKNLSLKEIAQVTTANLNKLFHLLV